MATQHYRRRFESCHCSFSDSHRPSVSELEPACALPRCHGAFFRNGRADECCGLLIFWPEHEMHLHASLLIGTPEKNEVFCTTQKRLQSTHCNRRPVACGLAVDDERECSVASLGRSPAQSLCTAVRVSMHAAEDACGSVVFSCQRSSVAIEI